jgi:hypothetical protein
MFFCVEMCKKVRKVLLFTLPLWAICQTAPPSPHKALKNGLAKRFALPLCSQIC